MHIGERQMRMRFDNLVGRRREFERCSKQWLAVVVAEQATEILAL